MSQPLTSDQKNERLLAIVIDYLQGDGINVTEVRLKIMCSDLNKGGKELYKALGIDGKNEIFVKAILLSLNIKPSGNSEGQFEKLVKSADIYQLLTNLYHDGHHQVGTLLKLIDQTKPPKKWTILLILGTLLTAGLGVFNYFNRDYINAVLNWISDAFPSVLEWLRTTFSLSHNIPVIGIIFNSIGLLRFWYDYAINGTTSPSYKLEKLFFKTITSSLVISAYTLAYFAGGVLPTSAACLFLCSWGLEVVRSIFNYYNNQKILRELSEPNNKAPWEVQAQYKRALNLTLRSSKTVWVKLISAILTTAAIAIWDFSPPGLVLTISCIAFIVLTSVTKRYMLAEIHQNDAHSLQESIRNIPTVLSEELTPASAHSFSKVLESQEKLKTDQETLARREQDLTAREKAFAIREQAVLDTLTALSNGNSYKDALTMLSPAPVLPASPNDTQSVIPTTAPLSTSQSVESTTNTTSTPDTAARVLFFTPQTNTKNEEADPNAPNSAPLPNLA